MSIKNLVIYLFVTIATLVSNVTFADTAEKSAQTDVEKANPRWAHEILVLESIAKWASETSTGQLQSGTQEIADALRGVRRIIPLGKTSAETGKRVQVDVGVVVRNSSRFFLVSAEQGQLNLIFGAPVSEETMELAGRNSIYLLNATEEVLFMSVLKDMANANDQIAKQIDITPLVKQDAFNNAVMQIGKIALMQIPIDQKLTVEQLSKFLVELEMRPYLTLDEVRIQESELAQLRIAKILKESMGLDEADIHLVTRALIDYRNNGKMAFEIISEYFEAKRRDSKAP